MHDRRTQLVWRRCPAGMVASSSLKDGCLGEATVLDFDLARQFASASRQAGRPAWRLPTRTELRTLIDLERAGFAMDPVAFPAMEVLAPESVAYQRRFFWSSTPYRSDQPEAAIWVVDFVIGEIQNIPPDQRAFVRLVRPADTADR